MGRNRTTAPLKAFYNGAFKLAVETDHAIMPALLFNMKRYFRLVSADRVGPERWR